MMSPTNREDDSRQPRPAMLLVVDEQRGDVGRGGALAEVFLARWQIIALLAFFGAVGGLAYGLAAPKWYRAQVVIAPVSDATSSTLSSLNNQLGGLASLVGIDLSETESSEMEALARLSSRQFIYGFLEARNVLPILFPKKWKDADARPTLEDGYRYFVDNVFTISEDRRNGLIKLSIDWTDPELAKDWANDIVTRINADRRAVARAEAELNLEYLNRELDRTNVIELRQTINRLIETEIRKMMLVNVREQYAFKVIDPAFPLGPANVVRPRPLMMTGVGTVLGGIAGCLLVLVLSHFRPKSGQPGAKKAPAA